VPGPPVRQIRDYKALWCEAIAATAVPATTAASAAAAAAAVSAHHLLLKASGAVQVARSTVRRAALGTTRSVRAFAASPWGADAWRHDKDAFKAWTKAAIENESGVEARQLYGFLAVAFGDVDVNKDGLITPNQFDILCEKVAALPRRFGMAPSWQVEYNNDTAARTAARRGMFDSIDTANTGNVSLDQWISWAANHIAGKVPTIDFKKVDFAHLEHNTKEEFLAYTKVACTDLKSRQYATFYEFLLCLFVEADTDSRGMVGPDQFDGLLTAAAKVPRHFGLAPQESDPAERKAIFDKMSNGKGHVTFNAFLEWAIAHAQMKTA